MPIKMQPYLKEWYKTSSHSEEWWKIRRLLFAVEVGILCLGCLCPGKEEHNNDHERHIEIMKIVDNFFSYDYFPTPED